MAMRSPLFHDRGGVSAIVELMPRLTNATVTRRAEDVVLTWEVDGDLDSASPWLLSADLIGGPDGPIHQFGFRGNGGEIGKRFYFDFVASMNYYTPNVSPQRRGNTWTAVFPVAPEVAESGKWRAALSFDEPDNSSETAIEGTF